MKNWLDPKVTLHGDTRRAGTFTRQCRYLLGVQVEQDLRFGRTVSRQRYTLGNGVEAIITHEAPRTYVHIHVATGGPSQESSHSDHSRYFAVAYNTNNSAAWNSTDGILWNQLTAPPFSYIDSLVVLEDRLVLVAGISRPQNQGALWLIDSRDGDILGTIMIDPTKFGTLLNCFYVGNFTLWIIFQFNGAVMGALLNYNSFTAQSIVVNSKILDANLTSNGTNSGQTFSIGSRRMGQTYADVFASFSTPGNGEYTQVAYLITSEMQTATSIPLPASSSAFTPSSTVSNYFFSGGPSGSVACAVEGLDDNNNYQSRFFVASDVTAISWSPPLVVSGYNPRIGYTSLGWVATCTLNSMKKPQLFISWDGSEWTPQPPLLWAPSQGISYSSSNTKTLIPEGTALLTNTGAVIVGPPAPQTTDLNPLGAYGTVYTGPHPAPWLNIYSS